MRRVLFISKSRAAASTRYRALQLLPLLEERGWAAEQRVAPKTMAGRAAMLRAASRAGVVVVLRRTFTPPMRLALRRAARRLVFDFDDAIYTTADGPSRSRCRRFAAMLNRCDQVWAGNQTLAEAAREHQSNVTVHPTCLDPAPYLADAPASCRTWEAEPHGPGVTLVWIGSSSTRPYLESIFTPLAEAAGRVGRLRLRVVADFAPPQQPPLEIQPVTWSREIEAAALRSSDIGVAPLPKDPWTRGKCGFKVLQYMAAGLPVIASPVGVNADLVTDGETGLHAASDAQWIDAVTQLASDKAKREAMGAAGQRAMLQRYTIDHAADRAAASLDALCG